MKRDFQVVSWKCLPSDRALTSCRLRCGHLAFSGSGMSIATHYSSCKLLCLRLLFTFCIQAETIDSAEADERKTQRNQTHGFVLLCGACVIQ